MRRIGLILCAGLVVAGACPADDSPRRPGKRFAAQADSQAVDSPRDTADEGGGNLARLRQMAEAMRGMPREYSDCLRPRTCAT